MYRVETTKATTNRAGNMQTLHRSLYLLLNRSRSDAVLSFQQHNVINKPIYDISVLYISCEIHCTACHQCVRDEDNAAFSHKRKYVL